MNGNIQIGNSDFEGQTIVGPGGIIQRDGGIVINGAPESPKQPYEVKKLRLLPLTERGINLLSAIVGLATAVSTWDFVVKPALEVVRPLIDGGTLPVSPTPPSTTGVFLFLALITALSILLGLRHQLRRRVTVLSRMPWLPALAAVDDPSTGRGRLALARFGGKCLQCGGRLRFLNMEHTLALRDPAVRS